MKGYTHLIQDQGYPLSPPLLAFTNPRLAASCVATASVVVPPRRLTIGRASSSMMLTMVRWVSKIQVRISHHEAIADAPKADFYFTYPYASWERAMNENTSGLTRQYFPKTCDLVTVTTSQLVRAVDQFSNRPRQCIGMKTPNQRLFGLGSPVALRS